MDMRDSPQEGYLVLCGASAYEEKYWLNPLFDKVPESIKEELKAISILFTQEAGGVFMLVFDEEGHLEPEVFADEEDITYDSVSAGLLTGEVRRRRAEMFHMLELYYRICVLHEDAARVLTEEAEETQDKGDAGL
ncbi:MAG: hypothetical protein IJQ12_08895 [Lachnospiraceae bacterium]|nr:hypothetical protein [Lachnospiraceae bacterium]